MLNFSQGVKFFSTKYFDVAKCSKNCEDILKAAMGTNFLEACFGLKRQRAAAAKMLQKYNGVRPGAAWGGFASRLALSGEFPCI
jgi:hypothetical protein